MSNLRFAILCGLLALPMTGLAAAKSAPRTWTFDDGKESAAPTGFAFSRTGDGAQGTWVIQADKDAPSGGHVLAQTDADATDARYPVAVVATEPSLADLELSVKCKMVSGKVDQACGLVWRYQDENNYYVTRANALENNVRLYTVKKGKRTQLASWDGKVTAGAWHELRVDTKGAQIRISWDGQEILAADDKTFGKAGKVGVWTKADSVTHFDDLAVAPFGTRKASLPDGKRIEKLTGAKGKLDEKEGVFKVSMPRKDLDVLVQRNTKLTPPLGLTLWAAFQRSGGHTMMMGDMVLLEDQVNPVMSVALATGLEVTALHNHFLWESPRVMFMHIGGMGDEVALAKAVGKVFAKIQATAGGKGETPPDVAIDPADSTLDPKKIDAILGVTGEYKDGVYKAVIGRVTKMGGHSVGKTMGNNTWAAFAGSDAEAIVDGDFAMLETELQAVLKALRKGGIHIVAIHNHMTLEEPRMVFLHYWGVGRPEDLARTVKAALDETKHD